MRAAELGGQGVGAAAGQRGPERASHALEDVVVGGLVERDADRVGVDAAQVQPVVERGGHELVGPARRPDGEVSKKASWTDGSKPAARRRRRQAGRAAVHLLGDVPEALGPVVHGVHRGDDGEQHLGGADVRRRLLAADVLLAGLQGEAVGGATGGVDGHADEAAGHRPAQAVAGGEEAGVRAAVAERHAEAL